MSMDQDYAQSYLDRGSDRLGLHRYPVPADATAVVMVWPAMGVPARYYRPLAQALAAEGLAVVVADLRGTGASTPTPSPASRYGYADLADDIGAVLDHLRPECEGRRILLLGHSLGGQACALHLARTGGTGVDGLVLVAVGLPWFRSYPRPRRWGLLAFTQWIGAVSAIRGVWPGTGFGGRQARGVMRDWAYTARHGRFPRFDGTDVAPALAAVRTPILAISVEHDQFTPPSTLDHLCAMMPEAPLDRVHLSTADFGYADQRGKGGQNIDHFTWVKAPSPIATRVAALAGS